MRVPLLAPSMLVAFALAAAGCGNKSKEPQTATWSDPSAGGGGVAPAPSSAPCTNAPPNPAEELARQPQIFQACLQNAGKIDANLCGSAKLAIKLGKDGKVQNAEVAQSSLPIAVTDCLKARLGAMQFACPSDDSAVYAVPVGIAGGGPNGECPGMPAGAAGKK